MCTESKSLLVATAFVPVDLGLFRMDTNFPLFCFSSFELRMASSLTCGG